MTIDGALNEDEWSDSAVQHYPLNRTSGEPAVSGDAAFLWDDANLYLSAVLEGEGDRLDLVRGRKPPPRKLRRVHRPLLFDLSLQRRDGQRQPRRRR